MKILLKFSGGGRGKGNTRHAAKRGKMRPLDISVYGHASNSRNCQCFVSLSVAFTGPDTRACVVSSSSLSPHRHTCTSPLGEQEIYLSILYPLNPRGGLARNVGVFLESDNFVLSFIPVCMHAHMYSHTGIGHAFY